MSYFAGNYDIAVIAGRRAYEAGLGAQCAHAIASSPLTSFLD